MTQLLPTPIFRAEDNNGNPLAGGALWTYQAGTTTPQVTYTDATGGTPNPNPVPLNARGEASIWLSTAQSYKLLLVDGFGVTIPGWPIDNVISADASGSAAAISAALAASSGSTLVGFIQAGAGAIPRTMQDKARERISVTDFGVVGDGTNESVNFQKAVDAAKGKTLVVPSGVIPSIAGITLSGSSYNNTFIEVQSELTLFADGGSSTFSGAWVGILFKDCDGCGFSGRFNGNRAAMTASEHIYCIGLAAATNAYFPIIQVREIRGDGIYIGQSNWLSNSNNSTNVRIGAIYGYNSADDGRNLLSIISVKRCIIGIFDSYLIGGVIGGVRMPGGLDIEPDFGYQPCEDIVVSALNIQSAQAAFGLCIAGKAITNDATRDWCVQRVSFGSVNITLTGTTLGPQFQRWGQLSFENLQVARNAYGGQGGEFDFGDGLRADMVASNSTIGFRFGFADLVQDFDVKLKVRNYSISGMYTGGVKNGRFTGRITGASSSSSTFAILTQANGRTITQSDVTYEVDAPFDGLNARAFRNQVGDTVTYGSGTCAIDCDWSGYSSFSVQCDAQIPTSNIRGRNIGSAITAAPANGAWAQGDIAWFTQAAGSTAPGALCIASGVPGTWKAMPNVAA